MQKKSENQTPIEQARQWVHMGTNVLRSTGKKSLIVLGNRIDRWTEKLTRFKLVATLTSLVAFAVIANPVYSVVHDVVVDLGERAFGWGFCYERDGSSPGFSGRKIKRKCLPDQVTLLTWRESGDLRACSDCDNRALQLTTVRENGKHEWTEYYLDPKASPKDRKWLPAHNWVTFNARLNRGEDYDEGFILQREDLYRSVCAESGKPLALQFFVSAEAGLGCTSSSWGVSTPFTKIHEFLDRRNGFNCDEKKNTLYFRWVPTGSRETGGPCPVDKNNPIFTKPDPDPNKPIEWRHQPGDKLTVLRRD